jgi:hypothetical protein
MMFPGRVAFCRQTHRYRAEPFAELYTAISTPHRQVEYAFKPVIEQRLEKRCSITGWYVDVCGFYRHRRITTTNYVNALCGCILNSMHDEDEVDRKVVRLRNSGGGFVSCQDQMTSVEKAACR